MDRYIGIDAHSESCSVAVMGPSGKRIHLHVVETHAKVLINLMKGMAGNKFVCLEEGELAEWLVEALTPHVKEIAVVQPDKPRGRKSDADDAWARAEQIRVRAQVTHVFKPTTKYRPLREAVRAYNIAIKDQTRTKNRLRSLFRSRGVRELDKSIYDPTSRPDWIKKLPKDYRRRAEWLGQQVDAMTSGRKLAQSWLEEEAIKCGEVTRLKTVPGLGVVRAAQIVALVVTPHRFRTTRKFWSYCGLGIVTRSSSDWKHDDKEWRRRNKVQTLGLNLNRQPVLKSIFKGAAKTLLTTPNPLHESFDRVVARGTAPNLARLTLARRIAAVTLTIWKKKEDYDPTKHRSIQEAA